MDRSQSNSFLVGLVVGAGLAGAVLAAVDVTALPPRVLWVGGSVAGLALVAPFVIGVARGSRTARGPFLTGGLTLGVAAAATLAFGLPDRPRPTPTPRTALATTDPAAIRPPGFSSNDPHGGGTGTSVAELRRRLEANPSDVGALLGLADLNLRIGRYGAAASLLRRAAALEPARGEIGGQLAQALLLDGRVAEAGKVAARVLADAPGTPVAASTVLLASLASGDLRPGAEILESVAPAAGAAHGGLVEHLEPLRLALAASDAAPGDPVRARAAADLLAEESLWTRAAAYYERGARGAPDDPTLVAQAARAHAYGGGLEAAREPALRSMESDPTGEVAEIALAASLEAGDLEGGARAVAALRAMGSDRAAEAATALEMVQGLVAEAAAAPSDAAVQHRVAEGLAERGLAALALDHALAATKLEPGSRDNWVLMARVLRAAGRPAEAIQAMERGYEAAGLDHGSLLWATEVALHEAGDAAAARRWLERLRDEHPGEQGLAALESALAALEGAGRTS